MSYLSRYGDGLQAGRPGFNFRRGQEIVFHSVQTGSEAHPASCPVGSRDSFRGGKAAQAWSWPLTSI
jgi:hypothetical protein